MAQQQEMFQVMQQQMLMMQQQQSEQMLRMQETQNSLIKQLAEKHKAVEARADPAPSPITNLDIE
eukprot:2267121-Ditylum_brightwellii.AAC.2